MSSPMQTATNQSPGSGLSGRDAVMLVARREVTTRIRSKAFIASLVVSLLLSIVAVVIFRLASGSPETDLGVVGSSEQAVALLEQSAEIEGRELTITTYDDEASATLAVENGEVDGVVIDNRRLLVERSDNGLLSLVSPAWQQANLLSELDAAGLSEQEIGGALSGATALEMTELKPDDDRDAKTAIGVIAVVVLFISVQISGAYIGMGVLEEKSNRVVELILSSINARHLLTGKLLGIGVIGLVQISSLIASAVFATTVLADGQIPTIGLKMAATGLFWFLLGYLLFGSLNAAGASLAVRAEDAQAALAPVTIVTMMGYFGSVFVTASPDSTLSRVASLIPMVSPFAMPGRVAVGNVTAWEFALAAALCLATVLGVISLAAKIYTRSVLNTDRSMSWKEAWGREAS